MPRRDDGSAAESVHGRTVKVRGDPEQHFRALNNVLAAEGILRTLKAKEFAQAPGITRRLRKKEQRRRIARNEATKTILQVLDPEAGWVSARTHICAGGARNGRRAGAANAHTHSLVGPPLFFLRGAARARSETTTTREDGELHRGPRPRNGRCMYSLASPHTHAMHGAL